MLLPQTAGSTVHCADGYAAYVMEQVAEAKERCADSVVLIEQRVDFSRWVEESFGTADCIIIADGLSRYATTNTVAEWRSPLKKTLR